MAKNHKHGTIGRAWRALLQYLFPSRCISCGETVGATDADLTWTVCFCRECMSDFLRSSRCECAECGKPYSICECSTPNLYPLGITRVYSSFAYDKEKRKSAASRLIFKLKDCGSLDAVDFAAELLANRIEKALDREEITAADSVITYAPRRRGAVRTAGADHMKLTAEGAAKRLGIRCETLFDNTSSKAQKSRDARSRIESASCSIRPRRGIEKAVLGRCVILVDDIMTSGATLSVCAGKLYEAGAVSVTVCVLAKSVRHTDC